MKLDRFDFEQKILDCWRVVDDIETLYTAIGDSQPPLSEDQIMNILLGMKEIYHLKFNSLFSQFETMISEKKIVD